jgi:hypothetical protein
MFKFSKPEMLMPHIGGFRALPVGIATHTFARNTGDGGTGDGQQQQQQQPPTPPAQQQQQPAAQFTQAQLDSIVQQRLARQEQKTAEQLKALGIGGEGQPASVAEFLAQQEQRKREDLAKAGKFEDLYKQTQSQLQSVTAARDAELAALRGRIANNAIRSSLLSETARSVAPEQVAELLRNRVQYSAELGEVYVVAEDGTSRQVGPDGQPYTIKALVDSFLATNKHFQRPSATGGGGNTPSPTTPGTTQTQQSDPNATTDWTDPNNRAEALKVLGIDPNRFRQTSGRRAAFKT